MTWTASIHRRFRRRLLGLLTVSVLAAFGVVAGAGTASAEFQEKTGHKVTPGQPYGGADRSADWLGSYQVGGQQVFCVQFEYKAPDTDERYQPGDELKTKWGAPLSPEIAANISYLLLRYGDTQNPDEAAALAHLLHSWTSPARDGHDDLNRNNDFRHIGYDAPFHLSKLPASAQKAVDTLTADAEANRGPWTAAVTPPKGDQTIGTAAGWSLAVHNAQGKGVPKVSVKLKLTGGTFDDGTDTATVTTDENGTATAKVTPAGEAPKLTATLSAPADKPYVRAPVDVDTQRVVSTGGEKEMTAQGTTKARTRPGVVQARKVNANTGRGIPGAKLRLTAKDQTKPALGQDGRSLVGTDGKPLVVTTEGDQGTASIANLGTPQQVCLVEASPPEGYEQNFDPNSPPSACGEVKPGETLTLELKNVPNEVPRAIPAGNQPIALARGTVLSSPSTGALGGVIAFALLGTALLGFAARRRFPRR